MMLREPTTILGIALILLFTYLIAVPILTMVSNSVRVQYADTGKTGQEIGELTTYYLGRVFTSPISDRIFWKPLAHTAVVSIGAMAIALVVGGILAWLISRTNMWGRKWFATALIVPYMLPSWTMALAWIQVFKNRTSGGSLGWLENLGIQTPDWLAYGGLPITLVLAFHYIPFVILLVGNALRRFDSQLEDSARILGANQRTVARRVIIPMMLPSLGSATTLIFAKCLGDFGVTYILGLPVGYDVLATSLYRNIISRQEGQAAVLAGAIVLIGLVSVLVDMRLVREARKFVTVGSKGSMDRRTNLGRWQLPATASAGLLFAISAALPLLVLFLTTVMRRPGNFAFSNFTLDFWIGRNLTTTALHQGILLTPDFWRAVWNTIYIVGLSALIAGFLGLLVGYVVTRSQLSWTGPTLRFLTFLPYLVPGIAFAVAVLSTFAVQRGPIPALYGTGLILILALIAEQMPFASRSGITAMMQLGPEPEEAAQISGAGWWRRIFKIVVPIQRPALVSGVLLPFISGIKALSLVIVLAVPGTDLLTTYAIRLADYGYSQASNGVVLMICAIAFFGTLFVQKVGKTSLAEGL